MISFYLFKFFEFFLALLPFTFQRAFFSGLAKLADLIDSKHKKVVYQNLEHVYKDKISESEKKAIYKGCHKNLMMVILQVMRSFKATPEEIEKEVSFKNLHFIQEAQKEGKKLIFVSAHYGNWELGAVAISSLITPVTAIYKKFNNAYFDDYLIASRSRFSMHLAEKRGAIKHFVKALKNDQSVMLMMDQSINEKEGVEVDFLGQKAIQTAAPAFLARKFDALIIPIFMDVEHKNEIYICEPITTDKSNNADKDIAEASQKLSNALSEVVKQHPEPWFWCHRRFKSVDESIYS